MQLVYSISWQTPGRVLVSAAVSCGNGERRVSAAGSESRGAGRALLGTAWVSGVTGMYWSSAGVGKGSTAMGAQCHLATWYFAGMFSPSLFLI